MGRDQSRDTSLPDPRSSPDCDMRGLEWMPLHVVDLPDSDLYLFSTGDEFKAAVTLMCKSWRQVPAGSLPNNDEVLAMLSGARDWTMVKAMAMREWVLCSDGRWYHPRIAAKAMEALPGRQEFAEKKTAEAQRKERERKDRKDLFAVLRAAGIVLPATTKTTELRDQVAKLAQIHRDAQGVTVTPNVTGSSRDLSRLGEGEGEGEKEIPDTSDATHPHSPAGAGDQLPGVPELPEGADGPPPCPHERVIALYAKHLPQLQQPRVWDGARAEALRVRWRQCSQKSKFSKGYRTVDEGLAFWDLFFGFVATCPALRDGIERKGAGRWYPDLPWLLKAENFVKVIEGRYTS